MSIIMLICAALALLMAIPVYLVALVLWNDYRERKAIRNSKGESIAGPGLFGLVMAQLFRPRSFAEMDTEWHQQYGDVFLASAGLTSNVVVHKPDQVKKVLLEWKSFPKANIFKAAGRSLSLKRFGMDNVLFLNGQDWQRHRRLMDPSFANLELFAKPFAEESKRCLEVLDRQSFISPSSKESTSIDIHDYMQRFTLEVLGKTIFGVDFNYLEGEPSKHLVAYNYVMGYSSSVSNILGFILPFYAKLPTPQNLKFSRNFDTVDELIYKLIRETRAKVEQKKELPESNMTMLEMLVASNMKYKNEKKGEEDEHAEELTDKELRDDIFVFFLAGHETSANSLCFALYSIGKNPKIQEKLYKEIVEKVGEKSEPTYEQIKDCDYLNLVLKETLRMYPPATAVVGRVCVKDEKFGDFSVPKGSIVRPSIYLLHHDKEVWGDPEVFRPERFLPEESKTRPSHCYFPFGGGSRTCIGNKFSLLEQKIFLAMLLQRYSVHLEPNYSLKFKPQGGILQPETNFRIKLQHRQQKQSSC